MKIDKDNLFVIGSHNTMTYNKPKNIFGYIGNIIAKCQSKDIYELRKYYSVFDIRISFDKHHNIIYRHGIIKYKSIPLFYDLLSYLNNKNKFTIVRLILEHYKTKNDIIRFMSLCKTAENKFNNIIFIGGNIKKSWKQVYQFNNNITDADVYQWVSSMAKDVRWYEKLCPYLYAKRKNKDNMLLAYKIGKGIHLFDFL